MARMAELREKAQNDPDFQQLKSLTKKYEVQIETLLAEVSEEQVEWRKDLKEIRKSYFPMDRLDKRPALKAQRGMQRKQCEGSEKCGRAGKMKKGDHFRPPHMAREMKKGHFLLLDPSKPSSDEQETAVLRISKVYPARRVFQIR